MTYTYAMPPYKIKAVEHIRMTTPEERVKRLAEAGYNPFSLRSKDVMIDLLTDSGTGAMSDVQWGAIMQGDESYAGSRNFYELETVVKDITGYSYVMPTHQGRGAEQVVIPRLVTSKGMYFISNTHFDTTRAHVEIAGATAIDCASKDAHDTTIDVPFKGDFDFELLNELILNYGASKIAGIITTVTNNSIGGQPVSMNNMKAVYDLAQHHGITVIIDGARYAENAYFIQQRDPAYAHMSVKEIAKEMFTYGDIFLMSAKKDGLVNIGGLIAIRDNQSLYETCKTYCVALEGFPTYGGLAGRDMAAMAVGLKEGLDGHYLKHRTDQVHYIASQLKESGIPVQWPPGGHAVFLDAGAMCPHIPIDEFPGQAVVNALYLEAGIRAVEIGSLLRGRDLATGKNIHDIPQFVRLTIPRRTYEYAHLDVVITAVKAVYQRRKMLVGLTFTYEPPVLRHFTCRFKPANK